jgi:hypothetical protein
VPGKHGIKNEEEKENTPAPPAPALRHEYSFPSSVPEATHLRRFLGFSVLEGISSVHEKSPELREIAVQGFVLCLGFYSGF